jgi:CheY-like chemotaxis protein
VKGVEGRLSQVFLNLLVNAAHAIREGHPEQNVVGIRTWAEGDSVLVEVSDTGQGIPPEQRSRIFEPFFTTKPAGSGSGLGLSICKRIVEEMGGDISFRSEGGQGTTFRIRLPQAAGDPQAAVEEPRRPTPIPSVGRGRILVVDDEPGVLSALARILRKDHEVVTASSGEEARQMLERDGHFDAVFCDLMMHGLSGMELHAWLAGRDAGLAEKFIFMTGGVFTPGAAEYVARVGNHRVDKPFDAEAVRDVAREKVRAARSRGAGP